MFNITLKLQCHCQDALSKKEIFYGSKFLKLVLSGLPLAGQRVIRYPDGPTVRLYLDTKHCYLTSFSVIEKSEKCIGRVE